MRIKTKLNLEGMRSSVALKDLPTSLGFDFMAVSRGKDNTEENGKVKLENGCYPAASK